MGKRHSTAYFLVFVFDRHTAVGRSSTARGKRSDVSPVWPREAAEIVPRLGVTVTRKVGNAVRRNRIKRLAREWFRVARRRFEQGLEACDIILIANRNIPPDLRLSDLVRDLDPVIHKWALSREC